MRQAVIQDLSDDSYEAALTWLNILTVQFFAEIGKLIVEWVLVEKNLLLLFLSAIGSTDLRPAAAAFYANINFRTKLDFVDRTVVTRLTQKPDPEHEKTYEIDPN